MDPGIDINNYLKLTQMNIRVGTEYIPWFEFYNAYFNQLDVKVNIFIRQLYGGSELYECDASDYDIHDLQFLTTPISNAKCKNKIISLNNKINRKISQCHYILNLNLP